MTVEGDEKTHNGNKSSVLANNEEQLKDMTARKTNMLIKISFHSCIHVLRIKHKAAITSPNPCIYPSGQKYCTI